jgi:nucleoside-diphosphate-sugar epimerase
MGVLPGRSKGDMRIFITGGSGFIGTNLVEFFSRSNVEVINYDTKPPRNPLHHLYWHQGDLLNPNELRSTVQNFSPDIILHMAARTDLRGSTLEEYAVNTDGVENLIAAVDGLSSLQRIIFASSRLVCKIGYQPKDEFDYCPTTIYGQSKVLGERIVRNSLSRLGCVSIIVRPTSIWGPWFDIPYKNFFLAISTGRYFHPGQHQISKSYGFVGNTVYELDKLIHASEEAISGMTIYLADYPPIEVSEMANMIQKEFGAPIIKNYGLRVLRGAAWIGDILKYLGCNNPPLTSFRLNNLLTPMVHDLAPLEKIVGPLPYSMEEGVAETVKWLRSQREIH